MANAINYEDNVALNGGATLRDYWTLLKPGVMLLVVFTGFIGGMVAPEATSWTQLLAISFAIALGSGGGAAINMWYDADIDRIMKRTAKRAIPSGKIAESDVLIVGVALSLLSVAMLGLVSNWLAAAILAFAIWFYACFYTMLLKRHTVQNIVIGGLAGALPPLIGWMAVYPTLSLEPVLYVLIIFLWTPPHFWALALYRNEDYRDASIPMLPTVRGEASTLRHILGYSLLLVGVSLLLPALGYASWIYASAASILGGLFILKAYRLWTSPNNKDAMKLFGYSILYLFILFAAIALDKLLIT